jgi:hypothetical protein
VNFQQRLVRFAIGLAIGTLLSIWMLGSRGCTEWFPAQRIRTSIRMAGIRTTPEIRCVLECLDKGPSDLEVWLLDGDLNWDASAPRESPQRYRFDLPTDHRPGTIELTFALSDTAAVASVQPSLVEACECQETR